MQRELVQKHGAVKQRQLNAFRSVFQEQRSEEGTDRRWGV
jgi:hypothetical protein